MLPVSMEPTVLPADIQNPPPLFNVDPAGEDIIRPMPEGRYFADGNGRPFLPIGYNHNPDWPKLIESNPSAPAPESPGYDPSVTRRWFRHLATHGVNLIRLMVETPPSGNLEDPVGTFRREGLIWLDHVVAAARAAGVRLMVTPYDTFWMNLRWETTTYSSLRGGPVEEKIDWYLKPALREAQKRRMRFLIDRYGNLGTVFAWELMNEADFWWGATPAQLGEWADEMTTFVRQYEIAKWGRGHMVTVSTAEPMPTGELADFAYRRRDFDFATTHLYIGPSKAPKTAFDGVDPEAEGVRYALGQIADQRPYVDSENGPIDGWIEDPKLDDAVHRLQSWAHLAAGGAGSSLRWPYRRPHHLTPRMLETLRSMRAFCDRVDWRRLTGPKREVGWRLPEGTVGAWFATDQAMMVFAARQGKAETLSFCEPPGYCSILAFDAECGEELPPECFALPRGVAEAAFVLRRDDGSASS